MGRMKRRRIVVWRLGGVGMVVRLGSVEVGYFWKPY
tara:strand:- start:19 stop:126 length:108 start_codon:yes stop_codon:yes gene_type:complete